MNSTLLINLVPDDVYLYKLYGIKNIISVNNPLTFDPDKTPYSSLDSKNILLIGLIGDGIKKFHVGFKAMKIISESIPDAKLLVISGINKKTKYFQKLAKELKIEDKVIFTGYTKNPEIYLKNASIHLQTSEYESFCAVIAETKAYGIPNIVTEKNYLALTKNGTIIVPPYDHVSMAEEAIKLLKNETYLKIKSKEAKESLIPFKTEKTIEKWTQIINAVYKGEEALNKLIKKEKYNFTESEIIMKHEVDKLKNSSKIFRCIEYSDILNYLKNKKFINCHKKYKK